MPRTRRVLLFVVTMLAAFRVSDSDSAEIPDPFRSFRLPDEWLDRFWADPEIRKLPETAPKAIAALVPVQAGFRFCRCPDCSADDNDDTLRWSPGKPDALVCGRCKASFPNDKIPAKPDKKVPEEVVEIRPGVRHKYPYHVPDEEARRWPEERLYLAAKKDYEARELLAKTALYAALKHRDAPESPAGRNMAKLAAVLILRFAQVYPNYALHYDQPNEPKFLHQAEGKAPRRRGYKTGKWDWLGSLDVPMNLVIAYAIVRDSGAVREAGEALGDPEPARTIERDLLRASAEFVRRQPEEYSEASLPVYRGMLAVARLLGDQVLLAETDSRIREFTHRGFYHDGLWREGNIRSHRRVMGQFDHWLDPLASRLDLAWTTGGLLPLARVAGAGFPAGPVDPAVVPASWSVGPARLELRRPFLLGGAGVARLGVGAGRDALDVEVRGQDGFGNLHFQRQAIRIFVGGTPILDDLDERPMIAGGWNLATVSHNAVTVDGLNQRESFATAREPAEGSNFLHYATDPDFQVATLDDPRAYPVSAKRYRQTIIVSAGPTARYALSVFEVEGGLRHDQFFHGRSGSDARWRASAPLRPARGSLLSPNVPYVEGARIEDGRWFAQSYGEFREPEIGSVRRPEWAELVEGDGRGVRLHLLGDTPAALIKTTTPDVPDPDKPKPAVGGRTRSSLVLRRSSEDGATLKSTFVTLFEPLGGPQLKAVGRIKTKDGLVAIHVESDDGLEFLVVNPTPGTLRTCVLTDGRTLTTDGLALRVRGDEVALAGGTRATAGSRTVTKVRRSGRILSVARAPGATSRGWFAVPGPLPGLETLPGKSILIRHGDGITHGWTIAAAENLPDGNIRLFVREEPGFTLDEESGEARFYQFPGKTYPGPHEYSIPEIVR